jgi:DGQHR domain-containing protein
MPPAKPRQIKLMCLREVAKVAEDGVAAEKPLLVGFAKAEDLQRIAKAPAFSEEDPNQAIAEMLQKLPVRKWQRPLDQPRIAQMAGFFSGGPHLMPNPVLLAENPDLAGVLEVRERGELVEVSIDITPRVRREGALWILDGQHRINALATSSQSSNPVPFVLLFDDGDKYSRAEFASIFAQVTTKAQPLEQPHNT